MPFAAHVIKVFIASPGDVTPFRDAIERELHEWNSEHAEDFGIMLLPIRWEIDAVPGQGGDGQMQINHQLVDEADILLGVFHARLGQPTPRAVSGTAEEIERMDAAKKPVHLYFCSAPLPNNADVKQLAGMRELKTSLQATGLTFDFPDVEALRRLVRRTMTSDARQVRRATQAKVAVGARAEPKLSPVKQDLFNDLRLPVPEELETDDGNEFELTLIREKGFGPDGSPRIEAELFVANGLGVAVHGLRGTLRTRQGNEPFMSFELHRLAAQTAHGVTLEYRPELRDATADLVWHQDDSVGWHIAENLPVTLGN
ncbi:DUF4062 domain-containing protein [Terrabacter sp. GCM10028922]|uniref:DUF4062 domain-containing protein n=1 Tax=Terrabacter sp. GCM10028922 TaxID=3273428 RepID=UPI00361A0525